MKLVLAACLLGVVASYPANDVPSSVTFAASMLRGMLSTDYGYQKLKTYLLNLNDDDSTVRGIRFALSQHSDEEWKDALKELFSNVPIIAIEPVGHYPTMAELSLRIRNYLRTDDGITAFKSYLQTLETSNKIASEIARGFLSASDQEVKDFFKLIFSGLPEVFSAEPRDSGKELMDLVAIGKAIVIKPDGIQQVRDKLNSIETTNPNLILAKTVLSAMSDKSLIGLVKEIGKNIPDVAIPVPQPDLMDLVRKGKDLLLTKEGITAVRDYFNKLETSNFLIIKVQSLIKSQTDEEMMEAISKGWRDIFGDDGYVLYSQSDDLRYLFSMIKNQLQSKKGFEEMRRYLADLQPSNFYVMAGKSFFVELSDEEVKEIVFEVLKNIPDIQIEEGFNYPTLANLFGRVKNIILTGDGLQAIRNYAARMQSNNIIVDRLRAILIDIDDNTLTEILVDIFQGV